MFDVIEVQENKETIGKNVFHLSCPARWEGNRVIV
jgi:hypothetical protein